MQSLFDDTKNPVFRLLCRIVNEISTGAKLTRKDILDRIFSLPEFIYLEAPESEREKEIVDTLFTFDRAGFAVVPLKKNFSLPPSDAEISWLSAILTDEELFFLLSVELREKLLSRLKDFPPLYEKTSWRKLHVNPNVTLPAGEKFFNELVTVVAALRDGKKLLCGDELLTVCRLEYDLFADKYFLVIWREELRSVEKIPVENLCAPTLSEENIPPDIEDCLKKFYAENTAEVSLQVQNTRNAVERCFALFSSFDKKSRLQDDGTYFLTVSYCTLDEEEIFDKIFSLGATAAVIAPKDFRDRVIKKFLAIKAVYD